jgi:baseplate upper protein BppU
MSSDSQEIGPYVVGELPAPLEYTFLESTGEPKNLTGYTAKFVTRPADDPGAVETRNATVSDPTGGVVTYTWDGTEFATPGRHWAELWVGNTTNRVASNRLEYVVRASVGPVPAI